MFKKKKDFIKILVTVIATLAAGALIYMFVAAPLFIQDNVSQALLTGEINITSTEDIDNYFIFLPIERVRTLIQESENKFLFPQISLVIAEEMPLIVREQQIVLQDELFNFVTVSGLSSGTNLYTTGEFIRGGAISRDDGRPYAWIKESWNEVNNHNVMLTYFSLPNVGIVNNPSFHTTIHEEMFIYIEQGTHYATLLTESPLPEDLIPGGVSLAVSIAGDDGAFNRLSLQNILTYKGRIVMIQR